MEYLKLLAGLAILVASGHFLVKGGVGIATRLKISPLVIGMTVVAFGTSAPEFLVSLQAAIQGNSAISIGNVVGSNIANIGLILGLTSIVYPLAVSRATVRFDWPMMMLSSVLFTLAILNSEISRLEGIIAFLGLIVLTAYQIITSRKTHSIEAQEAEHKVEEAEGVKPMPIILAILFIAGACFGLAFGADLLINAASNIAKSFGVSERVIGVTIVAFGTSLPELAASLAAALKKQTDIAIGNIVGSNIFNILSVIGLTAVILPIEVSWESFASDFYWMNAFSLLLILLIIPFRQFKKRFFTKQVQGETTSLTSNGQLARLGGVILVGLYTYYIYTLLF